MVGAPSLPSEGITNFTSLILGYCSKASGILAYNPNGVPIVNLVIVRGLVESEGDSRWSTNWELAIVRRLLESEGNPKWSPNWELGYSSKTSGI